MLLLNPSIEIKGTSKKNLPWHIYVDKSLSMKYHRQPSAISYKNGVDNFIKKLKKNLKIEFYSFGSSIDTINDISFKFRC